MRGVRVQPEVDGEPSQKLEIVGLGMPDTHSGTVYWVSDSSALASGPSFSCKFQADGMRVGLMGQQQSQQQPCWRRNITMQQPLSPQQHMRQLWPLPLAATH